MKKLTIYVISLLSVLCTYAQQEVNVENADDWGSGYRIQVHITPNAAITGWEVNVTLPAGYVDDSWGANFQVQGNTIKITNNQSNGSLGAGQYAGNIGYVIRGVDGWQGRSSLIDYDFDPSGPGNVGWVVTDEGNLVATEGNVGIGTDSPTTKLTVNTADGEGIRLNGESDATLSINAGNFGISRIQYLQEEVLRAYHGVTRSGDFELWIQENGTLRKPIAIDADGQHMGLMAGTFQDFGLSIGRNTQIITTESEVLKLNGPSSSRMILDGDAPFGIDIEYWLDDNYSASHGTTNQGGFAISVLDDRSTTITPFNISRNGQTGISAGAFATHELTVGGKTQIFGEDVTTDENSGALRLRSDTHNMLLDGNEIETLSGPVYLNWNTANGAVVNGSLSVGNTGVPAGFIAGFHGNIACEELLIQEVADWPDYVFRPEYQLRNIREVAQFIDDFQHLPDVPSVDEVNENGILAGQMSSILLKKIEELTLYTIDQENRMDQQTTYIRQLEDRLSELEKAIK